MSRASLGRSLACLAAILPMGLLLAGCEETKLPDQVVMSLALTDRLLNPTTVSRTVEIRFQCPGYDLEKLGLRPAWSSGSLTPSASREGWQVLANSATTVSMTRSFDTATRLPPNGPFTRAFQPLYTVERARGIFRDTYSYRASLQGALMRDAVIREGGVVANALVQQYMQSHRPAAVASPAISLGLPTNWRVVSPAKPIVSNRGSLEDNSGGTDSSDPQEYSLLNALGAQDLISGAALSFQCRTGLKPLSVVLTIIAAGIILVGAMRALRAV